ncbi:MAG: TrmH family RNA methyltransferase, partial [Muribaculaceae bacterium]|nr:TrmH family RNA methyltransferase [Muribaculaceae bacterium]
PLDQFRVQSGQGYAIVVGNEVDGIDQTIVDQADVCLEIPQSGTKHSLNVAISASVALWEFYKQMK